MDQLETLIIPTDTVEFNGQKLELHGLGLAEITFVVRHNRELLADLYQKALKGELIGSVEEIALMLLDEFVPLASVVIACGLGAPQSADKAAKLPLRVQVEAIEKIIDLTLVGEGGLEKLMEIVTRAMAGAANLTSLKP